MSDVGVREDIALTRAHVASPPFRDIPAVGAGRTVNSVGTEAHGRGPFIEVGRKDLREGLMARGFRGLLQANMSAAALSPGGVSTRDARGAVRSGSVLSSRSMEIIP
jgi:hypothetical protein